MKLWLYGAVGAGVVILFLLGVIGYERHQLGRAVAANVACKADVANFNATQTANLATNADLTHRLAVLAEARKVERNATGAAIQQADQQIAALDRANDAQAAELAKLYARDTRASAWAQTGVDAGVAAKLPGAKP